MIIRWFLHDLPAFFGCCTVVAGWFLRGLLVVSWWSRVALSVVSWSWWSSVTDTSQREPVGFWGGAGVGP